MAFGHKWEPAEATITGAEVDSSSGRPRAFAYTVEVVKRHGSGPAGRVEALSFMHDVLPPGSLVRVEVNHKTGEIRLDPHHPVIRAAREGTPAAGIGQGGSGMDALAATLGGLAEAAGQGRVHFTSGTTEIHVSGAGATVVGGEQTAELMSALLAGGSARAEAVAKIKELRAEAVARSEQGGHANGPGITDQRMPEGFSSGHQPSTFDAVGSAPAGSPAPAVEPVTFSSPAETFSAPATLTPPTSAPLTFTPPPSPAAPHGDAFSAGGDAFAAPSDGFGTNSGTFAEPADVFGKPAEEEF
jgi:hypothetical protein